MVSAVEPIDQRAWSPYDIKAWEEIQAWKERQFRRAARRILPAAVRKRLAVVEREAHKRLDRVRNLPGFRQALERSVKALFDHGSRLTLATLSEQAVIKAYQRHGFEVSELADIRKLRLEDVDKVMPKLGLAYATAGTVEGVGVGLLITGGEVLTVGTAGGGGAGPAAVIGAVAADAAVVLMACFRLAAHTGMYYGYSLRAGEEEIGVALGMVGSILAAESGAKVAAYRELSRATQQLLTRNLLAKGKEFFTGRTPISGTQLGKLLQRVLVSFGFRATSRNMLKALPLVGVVLGAGQNAYLLNKAFDVAHHQYRELFLQEQYGLSVEVPQADGDGAVPVVDIVNEELRGWEDD